MHFGQNSAPASHFIAIARLGVGELGAKWENPGVFPTTFAFYLDKSGIKKYIFPISFSVMKLCVWPFAVIFVFGRVLFECVYVCTISFRYQV